jgi:hypothetical protein
MATTVVRAITCLPLAVGLPAALEPAALVRRSCADPICGVVVSPYAPDEQRSE